MKKQFFVPTGLALLLGSGVALAADTSHAQRATPAVSASQVIAATGTVKSVDAGAGKVIIDHDPIDTLQWPRMLMDFRLADRALANKIQVGDKVKFDLQASEKGAYNVTAIESIH